MAVEAYTAEDILESNSKKVASSEQEKNDDKNLESKKRDKAIAEWIRRPSGTPLRNEGKDDEDKEYDVSAPIASTEYSSTRDEDDEGHEDEREDDIIYDHEYTVLYNAEDSKEEASSGHNGELSLS